MKAVKRWVVVSFTTLQQVAKDAAEADSESPGMLWMARSQRMVADEPQTLGALPRELVERLDCESSPWTAVGEED